MRPTQSPGTHLQRQLHSSIIITQSTHDLYFPCKKRDSHSCGWVLSCPRCTHGSALLWRCLSEKPIFCMTTTLSPHLFPCPKPQLEMWGKRHLRSNWGVRVHSNVFDERGFGMGNKTTKPTQTSNIRASFHWKPNLEFVSGLLPQACRKLFLNRCCLMDDIITLGTSIFQEKLFFNKYFPKWHYLRHCQFIK